MNEQCTQLLSDASLLIFLVGGLFGALSVAIVVAVIFAVQR